MMMIPFRKYGREMKKILSGFKILFCLLSAAMKLARVAVVLKYYSTKYYTTRM